MWWHGAGPVPDDVRRSRGGGWGSRALVAAGALLAGVGGATYLGLTDPSDVAPAIGTDPAPEQPTTSAEASAGSPVGAVAEAVPAPPEPGAPMRVRIPSLGVDAPVLPVKAPNRTLVPPSYAQQLGWWVDGAQPGAAEGSALVAGHTVNAGGGALNDLETIEPGAKVVVRTDRSRIEYVVRRVAVYDKGKIATDAERLFSQDVPGRLVLLTCEDWDGSRYLSNVVVIATPA